MSRKPLLSAIKEKTLLADGAMGTELAEQGVAVGGIGDEFCLSHPEKVSAVHRAYVEASADILLTNTFQASPPALSRHGLSDKSYAINLAAARLARDAMGPAGYVLGDVGPFGGFLEPLGTMNATELEQAFHVQVTGLLDGGVDGIVIETMTALEEIEVVCAAVRTARLHVPIVASLTFDRVADGGFRTMTGSSVQDVIRFLTQLDVDILGCNCGTGLTVDDYVQLVQEYRAESKLPIMVQPNAGQPRLDRGTIIYDETPEKMAAAVPALLRAGATIIGGCCGTTPNHIRLFREQLENHTT
ncbi:MAG: homocysteine S-methyltransferase family protein [Phycisphaerae bacterium]